MIREPELFRPGTEEEHRNKMRGRIGRWRGEDESSEDDEDAVVIEDRTVSVD